MNGKLWIRAMVLVLAFSSMAFAQDDIPDYDPNVPIDGGIGLLVAAGALFGIKKLKDKSK